MNVKIVQTVALIFKNSFNITCKVSDKKSLPFDFYTSSSITVQDVLVSFYTHIFLARNPVQTI